MKSELYCVCGNKKQFPEESFPEIAFIGKSNVGKSSLINLLLERKGLARTSSVPGKTQTINWYKVDERMFFVDLPGYGYAKVSKKEQERWGRVIETYLHTRRTLCGVILLIDIRHTLGENDRIMADWLKAFEIPTIVALTKADKIGKNETAKQTALLAKALGMDKKQLVPVSSLNGSGRQTLWEALNDLVQGEESEPLPAAPEQESQEGDPQDGSSII